MFYGHAFSSNRLGFNPPAALLRGDSLKIKITNIIFVRRVKYNNDY